MLSPYPILPTLRLLLDYLCPATGGRRATGSCPLAGELRPGSDEPVVTLVLAGDLMRARGQAAPQVDERLRHVIAGADLVIANCEGPVTPERHRRWLAIRESLSPFYLGELLGQLGIDPGRCVLSIANNHSGDNGRDGLRETLEHLGELGVTPVGLAESPMARVEVGGLVVGVVAWSTWMNHEVFAAGSGVARTAQATATRWLRARCAEGLDCLIGTPHWGWELRHYPSHEVRTLAYRLLTRGFDLIVGHHPHVLQPIEALAGGMVAYSLGNLTGPAMPLSWPMRLGGLLEVRVAAGDEYRGRVLSYRLYPCVQAAGRPTLVVPLDEAPPQLRARAEARLARLFPEPPTQPGVRGPGSGVRIVMGEPWALDSRCDAHPKKSDLPARRSGLTLTDVWRAPLPHLAGEPGTRLLCRAVASVSLRFVVEVEGAERIAVEHDPFILALNHSQRLEAVLVPGRLVLMRRGKRLHFLADWNMMLVPIVASIYRASGAVVVARKRARPRWLTPLRRLFDPGENAFVRARRLLEAGGSVGIFPEARMNRNSQSLLRGQRGAARLAVETGVAIVPAGVCFPGSEPGARVGDLCAMRVRIGEPLEVGRVGQSATTVDELHRRLMGAIAELSGKAWSPDAPRL